MNIDRLPKSSQDAPALFGAFDPERKRVKWCLEDPDMWDRDDMKDGTNWFQVWAVGNKICVSATQWYTSDGSFELICNLVTPDQAVVMAERAAYIANDFIDGGLSIEEAPC